MLATSMSTASCSAPILGASFLPPNKCDHQAPEYLLFSRLSAATTLAEPVGTAAP